MKTKKVINRILLSITPLRKKIIQRLKDNQKLAANAAVSCSEKKDWYNYENYVKRSLHYKNVISKIETKYKLY